MPEIGAARGVTKHTDLTNKEDAQGVIDHANNSVTMAKLVQEVQDLINGALQKSGGTMTGNLTIEKAEPQLIFKEPLGVGVISTTLADEADIQVTTGGGFLVRTSNAAKSDYVDRLWIPGVTGIADILLQNSNLLLQAGRTVDGVDVSEHVVATPIDHPDGSITNAKIASGLDAGKITTGTLADARLELPVGTHKAATPIDHPDASIRPAKLDAIDSPADGEAAAYDSATGKFKWEKVKPYGVVGTTDDGTDNENWVDINQMAITLTTGANPVLIIFSMSGSAAYECYVRIVVDDVQVMVATSPGSTDDRWGTTLAVLKSLSAGEHTIKAQWRVLDGGYCQIVCYPLSVPGKDSRALTVVVYP